MSQNKSQRKSESQTSRVRDKLSQKNPLDNIEVKTPNIVHDITPIKKDRAKKTANSQIQKSDLNTASSKNLLSISKLNIKSGQNSVSNPSSPNQNAKRSVLKKSQTIRLEESVGK